MTSLPRPPWATVALLKALVEKLAPANLSKNGAGD